MLPLRSCLGFGALLALAAISVAGTPATAELLKPPKLPPVAPTSVQPRSSAAATSLVGTFRITAGACSGTVAGSYFRMIQPGGTRSGPFVQNSDSPCSQNTYTPLRPGSAGGLVTGRFQPHPSPVFDGTGGGRAGAITVPQRFFGVNFATATNSTDPQTDTAVAAPRIAVDSAGHLSGDLRAFAAAWNGQHFNQGAPKPNGSTPGITATPTGTYDSGTGKYTLEWTSQIVGGPFNNFTGFWHLTGTFAGQRATTPAAGGRQPTAPQPSRGTTAGSTSGDNSSNAGGLPLTGTRIPPALPYLTLAAAAALALLRRRLSPVGTDG